MEGVGKLSWGGWLLKWAKRKRAEVTRIDYGTGDAWQGVRERVVGVSGRVWGVQGGQGGGWQRETNIIDDLGPVGLFGVIDGTGGASG